MKPDTLVKIRAKDWWRLFREIAIAKKNVADLFRQTHGIKYFPFDEILKEVADDFEVDYEDLVNVQFARFEDD